MSKDNVLFIMCDQWRFDALGCCGDDIVQTPNLDKLASEGVNFTQVYTTSPVCVPARQGLLTERLPNKSKSHHNGQHLQLNQDCPSFVRQLQKSGVETANWGKLHFCWRADFEIPFSKYILNEVGFNDAHEIRGKSLTYERIHYSEYMQHLDEKGLLKQYLRDLFERRDMSYSAGGMCTVPKGHGPSCLSPDDHLDGWIINKANEWLRNNQKKPWFLWVGPPGPHDPYDPPHKYDDLYDGNRMRKLVVDDENYPDSERNPTVGIYDCTDEDIQGTRLNYYRSLTFLDEYLGKLFKTLDENGQRSNTWIVFTSDHGDHMGDHGLMLKSTFHDSSARIPLIIRPPDRYTDIKRGKSIDSLISLIDVAATITDIMGAESTPGGMGKSLKGIILAECIPESFREVVYSATWNFKDRTFADADAIKLLMIRTTRWKLVVNEESGEVVRFTDMEKDPCECRNLKNELEYREQIIEMKRRFLEPYVAERMATEQQSWHPYSAPMRLGERRIQPLEMWAKAPDTLKK